MNKTYKNEPLVDPVHVLWARQREREHLLHANTNAPPDIYKAKLADILFTRFSKNRMGGWFFKIAQGKYKNEVVAAYPCTINMAVSWYSAMTEGKLIGDGDISDLIGKKCRIEVKLNRIGVRRVERVFRFKSNKHKGA
jgi:hypothetical protein